ncbi:MAG: hypothetical protein LBR77_11640, partial [Lachnospiraceae bacterium]|nr:hypothetical protein [Lachnospiraceae bacterium]
MKKVFLIGLGALGTMYAQALQKALPAGDFRVVADAGRIRRYRGEGIYANGERLDFAYVTPEGEMFDLPAGQADAAGSDEAADRERLQIVGDADSKAEAGSGEASDRNAWQGGDDGFGAGQPGAVPSDQDVLHCDQGACNCTRGECHCARGECHCALAIVAVKTTQLAR